MRTEPRLWRARTETDLDECRIGLARHMPGVKTPPARQYMYYQAQELIAIVERDILDLCGPQGARYAVYALVSDPRWDEVTSRVDTIRGLIAALDNDRGNR